MKRLKTHWTHLRKAITGTVILGALSGFPIHLERSLERVLAASPRQQAESILLIALLTLVCYIIRHIVSILFCHRAGTTHDSAAVPTATARAAQNGLERWARIHQQPGETTSDAVKRLKPFWNERETCEITITQRRRHEAAHAVVTHALGGTVMSANTHFIGAVAGTIDVITPIPSTSAAHDMWVRLQVSVAGAAQDAIDGTLNYGSSNDINTALCGATSLTAAGWRPEGYTGPLTPSDLIAHAIDADKQLLAKCQNAIDAVEHALTNKDELDGTEIHKLLDVLTATNQGGSDGGQSDYNAPACTTSAHAGDQYVWPGPRRRRIDLSSHCRLTRTCTSGARRRVAPPPLWYYHNGMPFEFSPSADKHGIPREDAVYAVLHHAGYADLPPRRPGERSFMFVGLPHRHAMRYIEVGVAVDGRGNRKIFHAMEVTDLYRHIVPRDDR